MTDGDETIAMVLAYTEAKRSLRNIAAEIGRSEMYVRRRVAAAGVQIRRRGGSRPGIDPGVLAETLRHRQAGASIAKIAKVMGCAPATVLYRLDRAREIQQ